MLRWALNGIITDLTDTSLFQYDNSPSNAKQHCSSAKSRFDSDN